VHRGKETKEKGFEKKKTLLMGLVANKGEFINNYSYFF
jgi:hypothetical protein